MKNNKPTAIGDILASMKKRSALGLHLDHAKIWERWPELAGPRLSAHGHPHTIKDNRLVIYAYNSVWVHRFAFRKWDILKRINRMAGREIISDIFVTLMPDEEPSLPQQGV